MIVDYFKHIVFTNPWFFCAGLIIPVIIYTYIVKNNKRQSGIKVSDISAKDLSSLKTALRHLPFFLRLTTLACIITALANPQLKNTEQNAEGNGIDIVVCIDISGSMAAKDLSPNRLEAAKTVVKNFIQERQTDRIGVVIFSGESFTQCPLTTDKPALLNAVNNLHIGLLHDGTSIGSGLGTSVERLKQSKAKSKIVVLLTDGEDKGGYIISPATAMEIAKVYGVKVYTIGVGKEGYVETPHETALGVVTTTERFTLNETLLKQIASETGGSYFRASDNKSLEDIYTEIDQLEKTKVAITTSTKYINRFLPFAIAALVFLFLEIVLRLTYFKRFP